MPITFTPNPGAILMCDFQSEGFIRPEMQKIRHCICVSPRSRRHTGSCLIVPLSTLEPSPVELWHFSIAPGRYRCLDMVKTSWVKADMLTHAAYARLDRVKEDGRFVHRILDPEDLLKVQKAVICAVGFPQLASNLGIQPQSVPVLDGVKKK